MKTKSLCYAILGALVAASWGAAASASVIDYTVTGVGSGTYVDGATVTPFADVGFVIHAYGDTSTLVDVPTKGRALDVTSATISALGKTSGLMVDSSSRFVVSEGLAAGIAGFGNTVSSTFHPTAFFYSPALAGYDAVSALGPISITLLDTPPITELELTSGAFVDFNTVTDATFAAAPVPEPAGWAMMFAGLCGLSLMTDFARRKASAAAA